MSAAKQVALLVLLVVVGANARPGPDGCDGLNVTLPNKDLHKVYGEWALVWSVADNEQSTNLVRNLSSSYVELRLLPDNNTIMYNERNMFLDKSCTKYFITMLIPSDASNSTHHTLRTHTAMFEKDGVVAPYNNSGTVELFESCSDCLVMVYRGGLGQYLLIYKRVGHHQDVESLKAAHSGHEKLAQCLGFSHNKPFSYDGAAEFCPEKSPEVTTLQQS